MKLKDKILLSDRDKEIFFENILNPKLPNKKLKKAAKKYKKYNKMKKERDGL